MSEKACLAGVTWGERICSRDILMFSELLVTFAGKSIVF